MWVVARENLYVTKKKLNRSTQVSGLGDHLPRYETITHMSCSWILCFYSVCMCLLTAESNRYIFKVLLISQVILFPFWCLFPGFIVDKRWKV